MSLAELIVALLVSFVAGCIFTAICLAPVIADLAAQLAAFKTFDRDGDGKPGGSLRVVK